MSHHDTHLHHLTTVPNINFLHLTVSDIGPDKIFKDQEHEDKVKCHSKATSSHCIPTPLINVPIKYQLPTAYSFWDIARTRF